MKDYRTFECEKKLKGKKQNQQMQLLYEWTKSGTINLKQFVHLCEVIHTVEPRDKADMVVFAHGAF